MQRMTVLCVKGGGPHEPYCLFYVAGALEIKKLGAEGGQNCSVSMSGMQQIHRVFKGTGLGGVGRDLSVEQRSRRLVGLLTRRNAKTLAMARVLLAERDLTRLRR